MEGPSIVAHSLPEKEVGEKGIGGGGGGRGGGGGGGEGHGGFCAICLEKIDLQETALVKGCEHAYCVTCILRWASYKEKPSCPQCKNPFESLNLHRSLDGQIHDYMFEESVCLLLRAQWFEPLVVEPRADTFENQDELYVYHYASDEGDDFDEDYYTRGMSTLRIGNRRWGDNGYVRSGHKEARPVNRQFTGDCDAGPSRVNKMEPPKDKTGRRAKRAMKREAADKAAAVKHQQHLQRLGRK